MLNFAPSYSHGMPLETPSEEEIAMFSEREADNEPTEENDPFAAFDGLINRELQAKSEKVALKHMQAKLAKGNLTKKEADEIKAKVAEWEAANLWTPTHTVLVVERQECLHCGEESHSFQAVLQRQTYKTNTETARLTKVPAVDNSLPKITKYTQVAVPMCVLCMDEHGFSSVVMEAWTEGL